MSLFGNIVNGIPIVGHVKGLLHYAVGDMREGDRAIEAATRTSAVMYGGAIGAIGGPPGIVAGAAGAGMMWDSAKSLSEGKPQGVIGGLDDIVTNIANGEIPVTSVFKTGLFVGADVLSGFSGGSIGSNLGALSSNIGGLAVSAAKDTGVKAVNNAAACQIAGSVSRNVAETVPKSQEKSSRSTASGSGSDPPREPNKGNKSHGNDQVESHLDAFLRLFNVNSLDDVVIRGIHLFKNLQPGQLKTLKKLIKQLRLNGALTRIVETVRNLLNKMSNHHITFQNFLSLTQFVSEYLAEQTAQRCEVQRAVERASPYEDRREENLHDAASEAKRLFSRANILNTFMGLYDEISRYSCDPDFRNIYSAVYHYFKHKLVPQTDRELSVANYYYLIQFQLDRVKSLIEYRQLTDQTHTRRELVFDRIFNVFGRFVRVRIVIKVQDRNLELSSCYILDDDGEYDEEDEGREYIDPDKDRS